MDGGVINLSADIRNVPCHVQVSVVCISLSLSHRAYMSRFVPLPHGSLVFVLSRKWTRTGSRGSRGIIGISKRSPRRITRRRVIRSARLTGSAIVSAIVYRDVLLNFPSCSSAANRGDSCWRECRVKFAADLVKFCALNRRSVVKWGLRKTEFV